MSANIRKYEDHLHYLPEKERKAAEEALYIEEEDEAVALSIVRQQNRSNPEKKKLLKTA